MAKAKKENLEDDKKDPLVLALEGLNKKYGTGTVMSFSESASTGYDIIPTGSLGLDRALGIGGYARGRLYELRGWESSGKTTICGEAVASAQRLGLKVAYIDGEHALDVDYFREIGVDTDAMLISQPDNGEQGFDTAITLIETGMLGLLIIDSDSSLIPKKVIEGEIGDANIGKKAKLNSDVYPKLKIALKDYNVACLVVSQYREKIGVMFGDPRTTQGGHALKFADDGIIELSKTQQKEGDDVYAIKVTAKVVKNKMAPPFKKTEFNILFGYGIDVEKEVYDLAEEFEILSKYGKKITYNEAVYEMSSTDTAVSEFTTLLRDNEELYLEIREKVTNKLKGV